MITPLPRRRPQVVAQQATTIDRLSRGRFTLGLGLGVDAYGEFSAFGEPLTDDRARAAALDRGIELLVPALAGTTPPGADERWTIHPGVQQPRLPIWVAGRLGKRAGPRRALRHCLEGLALVDAERWSAADVRVTLMDAGIEPGSMDVVLVGGSHPDPAALEAAGATWAMPEILPDDSVDAARAIARSGPPTEG
jgi:alkanesulfonate monooxygenase SsuD/methylene tetrahydromethanopterin reductase-like flavin-dependent oxidoreductase (luciferase family)